VTLGIKLLQCEAYRSFPSNVESSYKPWGSLKRWLQHHCSHFKAIKFSHFAFRCFVFTLRSPWRFEFVIVLGIQIKNQLFAPLYCSRIYYTLKPSTHIKINFKITPACFGPTGPSSGSTFSYPKVTTDRILVRYTVVLPPQNHSVTY